MAFGVICEMKCHLGLTALGKITSKYGCCIFMHTYVQVKVL